MRSRKLQLILAAFVAALTLNALLIVTAPGLALPAAFANYFIGPKMVRAEAIVMDGGIIHDFRLDRGRIRSVAPGAITLLERDGTLVTIPVGPTTVVRLNGFSARLMQLRRGMRAETIRDGDAPAQRVDAFRR